MGKEACNVCSLSGRIGRLHKRKGYSECPGGKRSTPPPPFQNVQEATLQLDGGPVSAVPSLLHPAAKKRLHAYGSNAPNVPSAGNTTPAAPHQRRWALIARSRTREWGGIA
jgi:hypothetical protein